MRLPRPTYANVVSTVCLFLLLGGAAYAATQLPKNSVGTKQLKANAVTGAKVKNGSLTGADIEAASLGTVPLATHAVGAATATHALSADSASRAGDASALGGQPASAFLAATRVPRIDYAAHWDAEGGGQQRTILISGPLILRALCFSSQLGETITGLELIATAAPGATIDYANAIGETSKVGVVSLGPTPVEVFRLLSGPNPIEDVSTLVYRDASRTVSIPLGIHVGSDDSCRASGVAVAAE
jgi:hypothetical protein